MPGEHGVWEFVEARRSLHGTECGLIRVRLHGCGREHSESSYAVPGLRLFMHLISPRDCDSFWLKAITRFHQ